MNRIPGRVLLIVAVFALLLVPIAAMGAGTFTDVPDGHTFKADIEWLASVGVTKGCNPPANTKFCPEDPVTRGQMAAFIHRLANGVIVHAKTATYAVEADDAIFAEAATNAGFASNADRLDGKDSTAFLAKTGKAADADRLDGKDSTEFVLSTALRPVATAMIDVDPGTLDVTRGSGFSQARYLSKGIYCLKLDPSLGIDATNVIVNVSVEWGRSAGSDLTVFWNDPGLSCLAGEIEIRAYDTPATPVLTDDAAFVATAFYAADIATVPTAGSLASASNSGENE